MAPQARRHYKRSWNTQPGEPSRRGRRNQAKGARAERQFQRDNPRAKNVRPGDFMVNGRHVEVKYGASGVLKRQKRRGARVVRYYPDRTGKLKVISEAKARQIKNRQSRNQRRKKAGRR